MKHSRHSQGTEESAAAEEARPAYRTGDEEDGCDNVAYISRKVVKGNMNPGMMDSVSRERLGVRLARSPWSCALVMLLLVTVSLGVLHTSRLTTKVMRQKAAIKLMQERLEETGVELDEHRRESIHLRSDIISFKQDSEKEHSNNEKLRSEIGGLRSDIGGVMKQLKDKTAIADRIWLENNAFSARLLTLEGEAKQAKKDMAKFNNILTV